MSYQVPHAPSIPKPTWRWPHWYSLVSLAFHSWVIWLGVGTIQFLRKAGIPFSGWGLGQRMLFLGSIAIAVFCLISILRRTNATWIVRANGIYSMVVIGATPASVLVFPLEYKHIFREVIFFIFFVVLANSIYTLYRIFRRRQT